MTSTQNPHPDAGSHPEAYSHLEEYSYQDASLHPEAKSHPEAELLEEADFHPEVDLHPEVNMLALADKRVTSGSGFSSSGFSSGSEYACACDMKSYIRKLKSISQRVHEPFCTMIRNVNYFSEVFGAELI